MFSISILAIILQAIQSGSELLPVETASGPVVGEDRWGWDSRFNKKGFISVKLLLFL